MYNGVVAYALKSASDFGISMMETFNLTAITEYSVQISVCDVDRVRQAKSSKILHSWQNKMPVAEWSFRVHSECLRRLVTSGTHLVLVTDWSL